MNAVRLNTFAIFIIKTNALPSGDSITACAILVTKDISTEAASNIEALRFIFHKRIAAQQ